MIFAKTGFSNFSEHLWKSYTLAQFRHFVEFLFSNFFAATWTFAAFLSDCLKFILRLMIPLYPAVQDQQEREEKTFSTFDDFYSGKRHHSILTRLRSAIRLKCSDDGAGSKLQSHFKFSLAWKILCTWVLSFLTDFIFRNASLNAASWSNLNDSGQRYKTFYFWAESWKYRFPLNRSDKNRPF